MLLKPVKERLTEFSKYHSNGDGECNAELLKAYSDYHNISTRERFDLSYFFSIVYCCESGIILFNSRDKIREYPVLIAKRYKQDMIFQSDRKYMKMRDCFEKSLLFWKENLQDDTVSRFIRNNVLDLQKAIGYVETWYMFGRFSAYLFLETYATLIGCDVTDINIDWNSGDTATSGLLNLFGYDAEADTFDKTGKLIIPESIMNKNLTTAKKVIEKYGGDTNTTKIETSLCAYRKFYKGTRYNGYYLDRMLEELIKYSQMTRYKKTTDELFEIRARIFPDETLGEKHGWNGIRKEQKKLYKEYGII